MKKHPPPRNVVHARRLRREVTTAERAMWRLLRECAPQARWRRQVPLRHYIVDFASHRAKLVVEVDGGSTRPRSTPNALPRSRPKAIGCCGSGTTKFSAIRMDVPGF